MHEKRVARAYRFDLWTAIAVYVVLLVASIRYGRPLDDGPHRTVVQLAQMIGLGQMIHAKARHVAALTHEISTDPPASERATDHALASKCASA